MPELTEALKSEIRAKVEKSLDETMRPAIKEIGQIVTRVFEAGVEVGMESAKSLYRSLR